MKKILLSVFALGLAGSSFAALNVTLKAPGGAVVNSGSVDVWTDPNTDASLSITSTNTGNAAVSVHVKKVHINIQPGTDNYFCWLQCYQPGTFVSPAPMTLQPNVANTSFISDFEPMGSGPGTSTIGYVFFDAANPNDSVWMTVIYHITPVGIADLVNSKNELSAASPNPCINTTSIGYSSRNPEGTKLQVYNITGALVREMKLEEPQGRIILNTSEMESGLYFYSLIVDNKAVASRKLVISH